MLDGVESVSHVLTTRPFISIRNVDFDCSGETSVYPANAPGSFRRRPTPCGAGPCANETPSAASTNIDANQTMSRCLGFMKASSEDGNILERFPKISHRHSPIADLVHPFAPTL